MKPIISLSGAVLISVLGIAPCVAAATTPKPLEETRVAGFFDVLDDALDTVEQERRRQEQREERQRRTREREEREAARQRRQEEIDAARRAATEEQRLEAERRRQYFDSLSPEEQKEYIAAQQERQEAEAMLFLGLLGLGAQIDSAFGGGNSSSNEVPAICNGIDLNGTEESCRMQIRNSMPRQPNP